MATTFTTGTLTAATGTTIATTYTAPATPPPVSKAAPSMRGFTPPSLPVPVNPNSGYTS